MAQVIADIQQIAGYEKFLALPTFSDIQSVVTSAPLIYCAATDAGGFALILHPEAPDDVTPLWLSDLTEETLKKNRQGKEYRGA